MITFMVDVSETNTIAKALKNVDSMIHLVHIKYIPNVITACKKAGVNRLTLIGSTGMFSKYRKYAEEYIELEKKVDESGLDYTVIRPTMIYGNHLDENIHKLVKIVDRFRIFPVLGSGENLLQPIYAEDLARVILNAHRSQIAIGEKYNVAGDHPLAFNEIIEEIIRTLNSKTYMFHIPKIISLVLGRLGDVIPNNLVNYERVQRLAEDKDFEYDKAAEELGFDPMPFEEGIELEVEALRREGII